jgi:tetratricopeptide (TPR) repeat protein
MHSESEIDLGIVIALKEEFQEFMALLPVQPTPERDPETGQYGYVFEHPVSHRRCVVIHMGELNPEPAALQTEQLLAYWSPRDVVMLGIAAGIHPDVRVGDVVIAIRVDNYLATGKAQGGSTPDSFAFSLGGTVFHENYWLLEHVRNFESFAPQAFSRWQQDCARVLVELVPEEGVRSALVQKGVLRAAPDLLDAYLASDSVVGVAHQVTQWLRSRKYRNPKAIDLEPAGFMEAAAKRMDPAHTLVIRGISGYGDERKSDLDAMGAGALRRYAMRNATCLVWALLEAGVLSVTPSSNLPPPEEHPLDRDKRARQAPFIGIPGESLREGFKGREQALEQLHALLQEAGEATLTSRTVNPVYAHGDRGMGKSRLAIEYAHRYREAYPGGVFFSYDEEESLAFVLEHRDTTRGPCLIIFDEVQAMSGMILGFRLSDVYADAQVSLLITTRMREIDREIQGAKSFSVERLDPEAALELLLERAHPRTFSLAEHPEARRLASEELGGHPLEIKLAGAYLGQMKQLSLAEYLERLREQRPIELSGRQLDPAKPVDKLALRLLAIAAYLAPGIPIDPELLQRLLQVSGLSADLEKIGLALARLVTDLALLDAAGRDVIIHPLISDFTRRRLQERKWDQAWLQLALLKGMCSLFPPGREEFLKIGRQGSHRGREHLSEAHEAHAAAVWQTVMLASFEWTVLSRSLGDLYLQRGALTDAWKVFTEALERAERWAEKAPKNAGWRQAMAVSWERLGDLLSELGDPKEAQGVYERSLEIAEGLAEKEPENAGRQRDVAVSLNKMGRVLRARNNLEWARRNYEGALEMGYWLVAKEPEYPGWQRLLAVSLEGLGDVLTEQDNLEWARRAYEQALEMRQRLAEKEPENAGWQRDVSVGFIKWGDLLTAQGNRPGALRAYVQAREILLRLVDKEPGHIQWRRDLDFAQDRITLIKRKRGTSPIRPWKLDLLMSVSSIGPPLGDRVLLSIIKRRLRELEE